MFEWGKGKCPRHLREEKHLLTVFGEKKMHTDEIHRARIGKEKNVA